MRENSIDIHGIVRLSAEGEDAHIRRLERELKGHLASGVFPDEPDLSVRFGPFEAPSSSSLAIEKNMIFARESYRGARWMVKVEGLEEERLRMFFHGNALSRMISVKRVVEPALRYLMDLRGFPMVHSACLVKGGDGVIVSAGGGGGKTTLLLRLLEEGAPFLSDDYTILAQGRAMSYITPLRIGFRNLMESPSLRKIPPGDRAEIIIRTAARYLFLKKVRLAYKADARKIFPQAEISREVNLGAAAIIRETSRNLSLQKVEAETMARDLASVNREEMYNFANYIDAYAEKFPDTRASGFFEAHRQKLNSIIRGLPCYELSLPRRWTPDEWKKFKDTLFDG